MFNPKSIKVGMLVRNLEGERLGQVVAREGDNFRVQQPGVPNADRYLVDDADVTAVRGTEIIVRQGPATMLLESEYERRRAAGLPLRQTAEGWRKQGGLPTQVDVALQPGMVVADVEGRRLGMLTGVGEGEFDLRCTDTAELATVRLGDVLNILPDRVVVRKGQDVLKNRREDHAPAPAP